MARKPTTDDDPNPDDGPPDAGTAPGGVTWPAFLNRDRDQDPVE